MLTSKQRAKLRALASGRAIFQIGKGNLGSVQLAELDQALSKRELIKVTVLKGCDYTAEEILDKLAAALNAEPVAAIGNKAILYRRSDDEKARHIEI